MPDNSPLYHSAAGYQAMMDWYDGELARLTVPYGIRWVNTHYGKTHIITAGDSLAPPVFLIHGLNANAATWRTTIDALAGSYHIFAPDVVGQAGKSTPGRPSIGDNSYGMWLVDVLNELNMGKAAFVGVSNGGWLTLKLAAVAPERIIGAFLMSSGGLVDMGRGFLLWSMVTMMTTPRGKFARKFLRKITPPHLPIHEDDIPLFTLLTTVYRTVNRVPPILTDAELNRLTAPTVLLMGEYEQIFPPNAALERARRCIPGLQSAELVPGVGHGMISDAPDLIHGRIAAFLGQVTGKNPKDETS